MAKALRRSRVNQTWSISLAPWMSREPAGHFPLGRGFSPRFFPCLHTTCECQRRIGPAGVGPTSPSRVLHIAPTRTRGRPGALASISALGRVKSKMDLPRGSSRRSAWKKNTLRSPGLRGREACRSPRAVAVRPSLQPPRLSGCRRAGRGRARPALARAALRARPTGTAAGDR